MAGGDRLLLQLGCVLAPEGIPNLEWQNLCGVR